MSLVQSNDKNLSYRKETVRLLYVAILRLRGFGCKMPIRANFEEFWGTLTP